MPTSSRQHFQAAPLCWWRGDRCTVQPWRAEKSGISVKANTTRREKWLLLLVNTSGCYGRRSECCYRGSFIQTGCHFHTKRLGNSSEGQLKDQKVNDCGWILFGKTQQQHRNTQRNKSMSDYLAGEGLSRNHHSSGLKMKTFIHEHIKVPERLPRPHH